MHLLHLENIKINMNEIANHFVQVKSIESLSKP
jgi:hypothetical protein